MNTNVSPKRTAESTRKDFLNLVQAGLWNTGEKVDISQEADWDQINRLAVQQAVAGIAGDGLAFLPADQRPSRNSLQRWMMQVMCIEKMNRKMNALLPELIWLFEKNHIQVWLLKGQGLAETYCTPLHRQSGDIDLLVKPADFERARQLLLTCPHTHAELLMKRLHFALSVNDIEVELHGDINLVINPSVKRIFDSWLKTNLYNVPPCMVEIQGNAIPVPPADFNVVYIFIHLFRHYLGEGVGLRQLCDWCRFLYINKEKIDREKLKNTLESFNLLKAWKVFGLLAVRILKCPPEIMPFVDGNYEIEAASVCEEIFAGGNFGKLSKKYTKRPSEYWHRKCHSFYYNTQTRLRHLKHFPAETLYSLLNSWKQSLYYVLHGK